MKEEIYSVRKNVFHLTGNSEKNGQTKFRIDIQRPPALWYMLLNSKGSQAGTSIILLFNKYINSMCKVGVSRVTVQNNLNEPLSSGTV